MLSGLRKRLSGLRKRLCSSVSEVDTQKLSDLDPCESHKLLISDLGSFVPGILQKL